jgi:hypothetical protein
LFNKRGFSLAEVMVGVGLMGVVSLGIMQIMKESRKVTKGTGEKIQIEEVTNQIYQLLRDPEVCRSTLFGKNPSGNGVKIDSIIKKSGILDIDVGGGATTNIDASELAEYNSKSIAETYIRADCLNLVGASSKPCTFGGSGISNVFLKELKILAYGMTHSTSGNSSSPYRNQDGYATVEITLLKGSAIGKVTTAELDKAKESSYGQVEVLKRISIPLMVDSSGKISDCKTELRNFSVGSCDQLNGVIDADEKCKDIKIQAILPEPALGGPPYKEAITTKGDTNVKNNLTIANTWNIGAVGTNASGNVNTTDNATINNKMLITTGKLILGTKSTLESKPGGEISLYKTAADNNAVLKLGSGVSIKAFNQNIGIQTAANPTVALEVTGDAKVSSTLNVDANLNAKADLEIGGVATFKISGSTLQLTGVEFELDTTVNSTFNASQVASENDLIAKRKWVYDMFRVQLGDATSIQQVIDELMTYAGATQLTQLRHALCAGMKNAVWTGAQCIIPSNTLCTGGQFLRGFINGNVSCQAINLGNVSVASGSFLTGFNTGAPISTTVTTLVTPQTNAIAARQEACYAANRGSGGKYNVIYDPGSNRCTASTWIKEYSYKGCGAAFNNDSAGDCNCGSLGSGWYYVGHDGCQYNWVVWGYKCKCARDL